MTGQRPELTGPPELFYNEAEARKYSQSSRYTQIQREMAFRAYELLSLPQLIQANDDDEEEEEDGYEEDSLFNPKPCVPSLLLDIGVGSGICAAVLGENSHKWVGIDISRPMLDIARSKMYAASENDDKIDSAELGDRKEEDEMVSSSESEFEEPEIDSQDEDSSPNGCFPTLEGGDLILGDMGDGLGFRSGSFDGAISISALQWLCNADSTAANPRARLGRLFTTLYSLLRIGARAVFQFYPENAAQIEMILNTALKVGFNGGMVVDYPDISRKKKYFLVLMVGHAPLPAAKEEPIYKQHLQKASKRRFKDKNWVLRKKEQRRKRGYTDIPEDTKYTARKRRPRF